MLLTLAPHPSLDARAFLTVLPTDLAPLTTPAPVQELLREKGSAPFESDDAVRAAIRDLLRHGGFKPTGRSKPSSEYLLREHLEGRLAPINPVVDVCNAVSLWSGLPVSVVDADLVSPPLRIDVAPEGAAYVFNRGGQEIQLGGLLCLFDATGPRANAVKDCHPTKTHDGTRRTLSVLWGSSSLAGRSARVAQWYRSLLEDGLGATTEDVLG